MKFRIVCDAFNGLEVQFKTRFWPFWRQCSRFGGVGTNTFTDIRAARAFAANWELKRPNNKRMVYEEFERTTTGQQP